MGVVHARCAGLDIHKDTVVACRRVVAKRKVKAEVRSQDHIVGINDMIDTAVFGWIDPEFHRGTTRGTKMPI